MKISEQDDELELELPRLAGQAFADAYQHAMASGLTVVVSSDGKLYEVKPDGSRRLIRRLGEQQQQQNVAVAEVGKRMTFRWKSKRMV